MLELLVFTKEVHLTEGEKMNRSGICQRLQDRWALICRDRNSWWKERHMQRLEVGKIKTC